MPAPGQIHDGLTALGLLGSVFKIGASILGGRSSKKASKKAQAAQIAAINRGIDVLNTQFDWAKGESEPWVQGGQDAQGALLTLLGLNSQDNGVGAISALKESPIYKALFQNGVDTTLANASATGGLRGGNANDALARVGVDTLAKVYQDRVANLSGVSNTGLNAVIGLEGLGAAKAESIASLFGKQGDVNASGIMQRSAINNQILNTVASEAGKVADGVGLPF